ncbi:MAG TPA: PHP-associated domain-containing protein, partial [Candidatus Sulfopaludibacter sp.]|nr:PHP-associated domain-containing protein [Candidatus Sulfopaludibacter sp.]
YNQPEAVYEKLKRLGMDLVTITDHDSIDALEALRGRPDFFLSEEVSCTLPSGTELHLGAYDIEDRDHIEIQRRRRDFESLTRYLAERRIFCSANHVFSSLTGRRAIEDFALFESAFDALETRNGHMLALANDHAARLADFASRAEVGGSDAHAMASVGCAYTVVPGARSRQEYLDGLRRGMGKVRGETGSYWKLTRDVLSIGGRMVLENPLTLPLAALGALVPLVIMGNYVVEAGFARYWMDRYLRVRAARGAEQTAIAEAAA